MKKYWFVLPILIFLSIFIYFLISKPVSHDPVSPIISSDLSPIPSPAVDSKQLGFLFLGYGGAGHEGGYLTDAIQVVNVDYEQSIIKIISIPRDLWVRFSNGQEGKINSAMQLSTPNVKNVVSEVVGFPIHYYIGIDFVGFQRAIGLNLKGIDVEVAETLEDQWYPITGQELATCGLTAEEVAELGKKYSGFDLEKQFPCRYEHLIFKTGLVHMDGGDAIKYVRSRHGSGDGDISRGKRQQEVISAIAKKAISLKALENLPDFFHRISQHIQTDLDIGIVKYLAPSIVKARDFKVIHINLAPSNVLTNATAKNGAYILQPKTGSFNWEPIHQYIQEQK